MLNAIKEKAKPLALTLNTFAAAAAALPAQAAGDEELHKWHKPELAEFETTVKVKLLYPKIHWITTNVHVDCDLLLYPPGKSLAEGFKPTAGFVSQFNVESSATLRILSDLDKKMGEEQGTNLRRLERYKGQMRIDNADAMVNTHMGPQHGIDMSGVIIPNARRCMEEHSDHGVDLSKIRQNVTPAGYHLDWGNP